MSKVSAIDAIIHPFQMESKSEQTVTDARQIHLGGIEKTIFSLSKNKSLTVVEGGVDMVVTTRVRTGKTKKDKANGHVPYKNNRRIWVDDKTTNSGRWVKQ